MINDTFTRIKGQLNKADELSPSHREELEDLVRSLEEEITELAKNHPRDSQTISAFAHLSTHEATRREKRPELLKHSLDGLNASVAGLEAEHPQVTALVSRFCSLLSNMGI